MINLFKLIIYFFILKSMVKAYNHGRQTSIDSNVWSAHISPEILKELEDFQNLIPKVTIDEIVAKHLLIDGKFRTAFAYLRSQEFTQLQRQILTFPEVENVLEFLHLTTTTRHMAATTAELIGNNAIRTLLENDGNDDAMTTNTDSKVKTANSVDSIKETFNNKKMVHKTPHGSVQQFKSIDDDIASSFNLKQTLVRIVLLENSVVKNNSYVVTAYNEDHHQQHSLKYRRHLNNNHYHHYEDNRSLGTFTKFVEEVLQHLPHDEYQNMIKDKCEKSSKFATFYQALRSQDLKPLIEQTLQSSNIKKIIQTLNRHDVDVLALEPIAFQVISWGPNIL